MSELRISGPRAKSKRVKPQHVPQRELEEVREQRPGWPDRGTPPDRGHARQDAARRHDHAGDARCRKGLPGRVHHREPRPAPRAADPSGAGYWARARPERAAARRPAPGARRAAGAGRHLQPGGWLRLACRGLQRSVREWAIRQGWGGRPVGRSRRRGFWSRRWGCWPCTSVTRGQPETGRRGATSGLLVVRPGRRQSNGLRAALDRTRWRLRSPHLRLKHRQKAVS